MAVPEPVAKADAMADAVAAPPPLETADAMACEKDKHCMEVNGECVYICAWYCVSVGRWEGPVALYVEDSHRKISSFEIRSLHMLQNSIT